jgi:hypothetical protein
MTAQIIRISLFYSFEQVSHKSESVYIGKNEFYSHFSDVKTIDASVYVRTTLKKIRNKSQSRPLQNYHAKINYFERLFIYKYME